MHLSTGPGEFFTEFPGDIVVAVVLALVVVFGVMTTTSFFKSRDYDIALPMLTFTLAIFGSLAWFVTGSVVFVNAFGTMDSLTLPILQIGVIALYAAGASLVSTIAYFVFDVLQVVKSRRKLGLYRRTK